MPETEWTPLHDFYAQDLDHNLTVVEHYVESGDPYKIHECAQVFLTLWTTYVFLRKDLNAHDRLALGRLLCRVRGSPPYRIPVRLKTLDLAKC